MAMIKCKMCGGDLVLAEGQSVAECEYCGSRQTVPSADNEKKLNLFASANKLRFACEFDRAAGVYDAIKAEFPSEAEAYWGLVLCKYGIEYVDDPATGRKVPTCHRLSYDCVMDDANLNLAMDCADAVARKVYREEARQLEKLRVGILEVSSNETPYDVFICYKETDENGDRTLDSVLAQDLYSALTQKGYRVFFSRITLQSKLGEAYEPYIFAALNSAKVMLAIGTDPEYYSAVWVKNEWSRYLKICAEDSGKHLIPCYKDMDAYDLPREFRPLQGVDLGKMGAVQDILFNMEKYIPLKKQPEAGIPEKVVVGGTGGSNKIASLLDRGNMALEDGDWGKADSFFEDVLNNDSKNAQAYLGKTLAQEKCRTLDALVRKRRDVYQSADSETLYIPQRQAHVAEMVGKYTLPGYVKEETIRELYDVDRSYSSEVSNRQRQYREEESWWQNHRWLSRAEKFAVDAVAQTIQDEKKHLFAQLNDRVKKAQEADARAAAKLEAAYDLHIAEADRQAEKIYHDGLALREQNYQSWLEQAKVETSPYALKKLAQSFEGLGAYQDSSRLAEHCRKRAAEEQAKIDAEGERRRVLAEQEKKARQKRNKRIAAIAVIAAAIAVTIFLVVTKILIPAITYQKAEALLENGRYEEAISVFASLGDYNDSSERIQEAQRKAQYDAAAALADSGNTVEAAIAFAKLGDYQDAIQRSAACWNIAAVRDTVSAGFRHTVGLKRDGTVVAVGRNVHGQCNVSGWQDVVAISAGNDHTAGLKADGTVVAAGNNYTGECNVSGWQDIVAISAVGNHTVGLKADGTVVAVGWNKYGQCDVSGWQDIVAISVGGDHTVGLKADGTVVAVGQNMYGQCDVSGWQDIVAISAGYMHTVGLKEDGTVVAVGFNEDGECDVSGWQDIVAISTGYTHTVGLKEDGTVVAVGYNEDGRCNVSGWQDIVTISVESNHTVGLKADGTVVAVGQNMYGQCDVSGWQDIVAISAGFSHTVGLKADGTVVAVGRNDEGRCDVSGWTGIKLPG